MEVCWHWNVKLKRSNKTFNTKNLRYFLFYFYSFEISPTSLFCEYEVKNKTTKVQYGKAEVDFTSIFGKLSYYQFDELALNERATAFHIHLSYDESALRATTCDVKVLINTV